MMACTYLCFLLQFVSPISLAHVCLRSSQNKLKAEILLLAVAYVRYDRASSAALAMESLNGATLNDGRGPKLKVMLAEAPSTR